MNPFLSICEHFCQDSSGAVRAHVWVALVILTEVTLTFAILVLAVGGFEGPGDWFDHTLPTNAYVTTATQH